MLAATDRPCISGFDRHLRSLGVRVPLAVFRAAYKELCTRIWIELELLAQAATQVESPTQDLMMRTEILRLELIVLLDSCRSTYWRRILTAEQRDGLCSMSADLLAALHVDMEELPTGIAQAQDRILDELLPESEAGLLLAAPASACELEQGSHPAVDALIRLIEAQSAARPCEEPVAEVEFV